MIFKQKIAVYIGALILFITYKLLGKKKSFNDIINASYKQDDYNRIRAFYIGILVLLLLIPLLKWLI
ncbi:hypothetical protein SAMN05443634_106109 [Chishuiella changwenlii]|nr:hypothetical protein [Chishuiella changwenlii]SHL13827.1 hypothetical protein SAMN05443634_106109 [Chishuiella changwenlii]